MAKKKTQTETVMKKVGLLVGREWSWPPKFIEEVASRKAGVEAEFVKLGGTGMDERNPYSVIVDRISQIPLEAGEHPLVVHSANHPIPDDRRLLRG